MPNPEETSYIPMVKINPNNFYNYFKTVIEGLTEEEAILLFYDLFSYLLPQFDTDFALVNSMF